jgi:hypothetical protein
MRFWKLKLFKGGPFFLKNEGVKSRHCGGLIVRSKELVEVFKVRYLTLGCV